MKFLKLNPESQLYKAKFGELDIYKFLIVTHQGDQVGRVIGSLVQDENRRFYLAAEVGAWLLRKEIAIPLSSDYQVIEEQQQISISLADRQQAVDLIPGQVSTEPSEAVNQPAAAANIQLLEERLVVNMHRRKLGEVIVRKVVETEIIEVAVRREKLVVEQISPEYQQLAVVDLRQLDGVEIQPPAGGSQFDSEPPTAPNSPAAIPIAQAVKMLIHLSRNAEFAAASVKLQFDDPVLQAKYGAAERMDNG